MDKKIDNSEIDLIEVIINLWNNKYKIILITLVFTSIGIFNHLIQKKTISRINTITEIMPISNNDEVKYDAYNYFITKKIILEKVLDKDSYLEENLNTSILENFINTSILENFKGKKIEKSYLLKLFIDLIREDEFISSIVKESKLIKKENYSNNEEYENKVNQLVKSIELLQPVYNEENNKQLSSWQIQFLANDIDAWKNFLKLLNNSINREVQSIVRNNFEDYKNNKRRIYQHKIEDIETKITNTLENYKIETSNRIAFLTEQAAIARKLEIAKATLVTGSLESQTFSTESGIITNLKTETPYYMRGYEMIEKEIDLIKERKDPQAFNGELVKLKFKRKELLQDKEIERMQIIFDDTPIMKSDEFYAARIMFEKTKYNNLKKDNKLKMIYLSGIIGLIFGILYVMLSLAIQKRNNTLKN